MKGYWLVLASEVTDTEARAEYSKRWAPIAEKYQARINTNKVPPLLKEARNTARVLVIEFPSLEMAKACYDDPDYQAAMKFAQQSADRDLLIFEGDIA